MKEVKQGVDHNACRILRRPSPPGKPSEEYTETIDD